MSEKKITVIIPCYNGFRYMEKCLNALETQTYKDFKVIIVDDCSTDDSYEELYRYKFGSQLDITLFRNDKNQKSARTRLIGVQASDTEWISFCDCDDWYETVFFEKMLSKAETTVSEIVMCHFNYAYTDGRKKYLKGLDILSDQSTKKEFLAYTPMSLCRFILKRTLYDNLEVPQINNAEDGVIVPQLIAKCKNISIIHEGLYNYYIRDGSLSITPNSSIYKDFVLSQSVIEDVIGLKFPLECEFIGISRVCYGAVLNALKANVPMQTIKTLYDNFNKKHPSWYCNPYNRSFKFRKRAFFMLLHYRFFLLLKLYAMVHQRLTRAKERGA
jgi:glycosyltransferase involved in cell wall biosynthesis